jgi:hypothetical protein
MTKPKPPKSETPIPLTHAFSERDWELFTALMERDFDAIQQKHHPFAVTGKRPAFEFPATLEDDEWEEP